MQNLQEDQKLTPMMAQWQSCKKMATDALLLFRMGDFYEAFYDDAVTLSKELELTLTKRQDIPMSGIPHHTSENYIDRLVSKGYRVAVAEQTEDPKKAKGLVKREVVRIVTAGTVINSSLIKDKTNNFVASIAQVGKLFGIALLDLTTADFTVIEVDNEQDLLNEIYRASPSEIVISPKLHERQEALIEDFRKSKEISVAHHDEWRFDHKVTYAYLTSHFKVQTLDGFGLKGNICAINAAGALLSYLKEILCLNIDHIQEISTYSTSQYMSIDKATARHLELTESIQDGTSKNTLLSILDRTLTPMGARLLRQWVKQPLIDITAIIARQDAIEAFIQSAHLQKEISQMLNLVRDIERLMTRIVTGFASPRDLIALKNSYEPIPYLKDIIRRLYSQSNLLITLENSLEPLPELVSLIKEALVDEPPARLSDGRVFRDGFNQELDELRAISKDSKAWLLAYQEEVRVVTGIKTLRVNFNKLSGYFIEVSKGQTEKMGEGFQRRQTLTNAERYTSPKLKSYESKVLHAEERISSIEIELFNALRLEIAKYAKSVQKTAEAIAHIDTLQSLGAIARDKNYCRPIIDASSKLEIAEGRHPVIEAYNHTERFIPNDTLLGDESRRLMLITGPNMAGKSTYIRQVALIVILAQMGSFVPAKSAHIGLIDKVFSRIGASDDLSRGQSTFMVEMTETANILNNATSKSLVILDEIGRGTSTYDGISIAWSVAEYLLTTEGSSPKTLFATHYFELTKLEEKVRGAINYNIAVHESAGSIIFLRKIVPGGTDKSYGIHVASLAGLPNRVLSRAKEILIHLEENANRKSAFEPTPAKQKPQKPKQSESMQDAMQNIQLTFF